MRTKRKGKAQETQGGWFSGHRLGYPIEPRTDTIRRLPRSNLSKLTRDEYAPYTRSEGALTLTGNKGTIRILEAAASHDVHVDNPVYFFTSEEVGPIVL